MRITPLQLSIISLGLTAAKLDYTVGGDWLELSRQVAEKLVFDETT